MFVAQINSRAVQNPEMGSLLFYAACQIENESERPREREKKNKEKSNIDYLL